MYLHVAICFYRRMAACTPFSRAGSRGEQLRRRLGAAGTANPTDNVTPETAYPTTLPPTSGGDDESMLSRC